MSRIIKLFLKQGFTPVDNRVFKLGSVIPFDCYIQRFNGFFIVLESGTFLNESTYRKLVQKNLQIFVQTRKYEDYKTYVQRFSPQITESHTSEEIRELEDILAHCYDMRSLLKQSQSLHDKLKIIYTYSKYLLNAWLHSKERERVPVDAVSFLMEEFVFVANSEHLTLSKFNDFLDEEDDLAAHLVKVAFFAAMIGSRINLDFSDQKKLLIAAILHDVGKTELDDELLHKSDFLSEFEYKLIQQHAEASAHMVRKSGLKDRVILNAIKDHHERLDGSGYPKGSKEDRISMFGKILAVCDMFDAMITIKPYRGAYGTYNALKLMRIDAREKLDMRYVNLLVKDLK